MNRSWGAAVAAFVVVGTVVLGSAESVSASIAGPQAAGTGEPSGERRYNSGTGQYTGTLSASDDPGWSRGSEVEVTRDELLRWARIRERCIKISAHRDYSGDLTFGQDFYDANCVARVDDPAAAVRDVVAAMDLRSPNVVLTAVPGWDPTSLVSIDSWMWVQNQEIFEVVTDTATVDPWTISVSGRVEWIDWDMGDGQVVRCTGPGKALVVSRREPSSDCAHAYTEPGQYLVHATAHWVVQWSAGGQSGTVVTDQTSTVPFTVGDRQVLRERR